jgi:hypothetical protein
MVSGTKENYYETLQVSPNASGEIIEKAYRTLMKRYHPDLAPANLREEYGNRARRLNEAHDVLCDDTKRSSYDRSRREAEAKVPTAVPSEKAKAPRTSTVPKPAHVAPTIPKTQPAPVASIHEPHWIMVLQDLAVGIVVILRWTMIVLTAVLAIALLSYLVTTVFPWFMNVVVPIAWPGLLH